MIALLSFSRSRLYLNLLLAVSVCLLPACAMLSQKKGEPSYQELKRTLEKRDASLKATEEKMATMQLRLLEKEAQLNVLEKRLNSQQINVDEAIQEVVRAKAKLRSLESKAEAASEMAEAEIAVKALKVQLAGNKKNPDFIKAQELLKMSAREFNRENYGGALYLTGQAKGHIKIGQMRLGSREEVAPVKRLPPVKGEVLFALPLSLQVMQNSNLRQGPDLKSEVLTQLEKGTSLIGYSYKGQWVRVNTDDGANGWIFHTLVGGR